MSEVNTVDMGDWCDQVTQDGSILSMSWTGGGDDGFIHLRLNNTSLDEEAVPAALVDRLYDGLGYGGFSGNFSCCGEATYDPITGCFEGNDTYSIADSDCKKCAIEVRLSKAIWFDEVVVRWQGEEDESPSVTVNVVVRNGPHTETHVVQEIRIADTIAKAMTELMETVENYAGMDGGIAIPATEFERSGPDAVAFIQHLVYSYYDRSDTPICISIIHKTQEDD